MNIRLSALGRGLYRQTTLSRFGKFDTFLTLLADRHHRLD